MGLGYRVPMIVASPWSRGGWVNSEIFDITSTLQFLEKFLSKKIGKEIKESNISAWRRAICGDMTSVFRPYKGEQISLPKFIQKNQFVEKINNARYRQLPSVPNSLTQTEIVHFKLHPFDSTIIPHQEPGIRNSCALPYQLMVDGNLSKNKKNFDISFVAGNEIFGIRSAGAPFGIYAPGKYASGKHEAGKPLFENMRIWNYAVKAGDKLNGHWPLEDFENGLYHLRVYGPNGFFREFNGSKDDPDVLIVLGYERGKKSSILMGNISLLIKNTTSQKQIIELKDAYQRGTKNIVVKPGTTLNEVIELTGSHNWYDLNLRIKSSSLFERRYCGRIETSRHSKTDPVMGRVI